ncbi:pyridoxal 5'-phosphate synthase glutaminase subunit PdxT [Kineococcus glutinatus]|uniref:Pyridoxal 5'-phosphate synthase subunit PdxT n=1 Tax=Kineococcus glutinatus TaxID=1070872 RepID=A0ABP9HSF8_9ACTN
MPVAAPRDGSGRAAGAGAPVVGVLAMQGDVREHLAALRACGAEAVLVRRPAELAAVDGIVLPGGESTAIDRLLTAFGMREPLREALAGGLPAYGSCAGMILLADRVADAAPGQRTLGGLDVLVRRNAFGRQVVSWEEDLAVTGVEGGPVRAVFIRAPWVEEAGDGVEVLARVGSGPAAGRIVAVRHENLLATSFHPEITGDPRVHRAFVRMVAARKRGAAPSGFQTAHAS